MNERALGRSDVAGVRAAVPSWLWGIALLGLGALLGGAIGKHSARVETRRAEQSGRALPASESSPSARDGNLETQLQRKMLELMAQPQPSAAVPSDDPQVNEPTTPQLLDGVRRQARDESWAGTTEQTLEQDLGKLGRELGFHVDGIDCRSSRCLAELEWPSGAEAQRDFKAVLSNSAHRVDCQRRLLLPPAEANPARGQLIITCDSQKQGRTTP